MTHLTMEQLLAVREPGLEPGVAGWRDHASACDLCRAELDRLDQRVARLRALPALQPSRNRFAEIRTATSASRRRKRWVAFSAGGFAVAASLTLAVVLTRTPELSGGSAQQVAEQQELDSIIARSRSLEGAIQDYNPDQRVTDGRTAVVAASLEDRLARVDDQLQMVNMMDQSVRREAALRLWRERVGLLNALVDVHVTRARAVGF
ncbi:MAG TPA: hypothetical protein VGP87_13425 [Gemmatimonadales bacterium]|jgi:hypothetical protein|nr:hypothetical protein [Gemmatimonadales bacterium]